MTEEGGKKGGREENKDREEGRKGRKGMTEEGGKKGGREENKDREEGGRKKGREGDD